MYQCQWLTGTDDLTAPFSVRTEVFVWEQGFQKEFDEHEADAHHLLILDEGRPVATGRIYPVEESGYQLGRIAVVKEYRGKKLGRMLVEEMEKKAKALGGNRALIGGQTRVQGFYEQLGYAMYGEAYEDEGCPHVHLAKKL